MNRKGFTLVEMMVSLVLGTIVVAGAMSFLVSQTRLLTYNELRSELNDEARNVTRLVERDVRMAGYGVDSLPLVITDDSLVVRYINYQTSEPSVIIYTLEGKTLIRQEFSMSLTRRLPVAHNIAEFSPAVSTDTSFVSVDLRISKNRLSRRYGITVSPRNLNF